MTGEKLLDRMHDIEWHSPELTFLIVRHPRSLDAWRGWPRYRYRIDVIAGTYNCEGAGRRSHRGIAPDIEALAKKVCRQINCNWDDEYLAWSNDRCRVRVRPRKVLPERRSNSLRQSRRKRFRSTLDCWLDQGGNRSMARCCVSLFA